MNDFKNQIERKNKTIRFTDFKSLQILLASKQDILDWSFGEITKPETINYRTLKAEKDGLFDERIFGPTKDWECYCGKYKRIRYKGIICDKCGVEIILSKVRRERMGHITLATPVAHVWYFKGTSSFLSTILDVSQKSLESIIYYASYLVTSIDEEKKKEALDKLANISTIRKEEIKKTKTMEEETLTKEVAQKIKEAKIKFAKKPDQERLIAEELNLALRQKINRLSQRYNDESKKLDEIAEALTTILKGLKIPSVLSEEEYYKILEYEIPIFFKFRTGAEAILDLVKNTNFNDLIISLREELQKEKTTSQKYLKLIKRLRLFESMKKAGVSPESMILEALPVIPPDLRPMVQLIGGRFATSDLNDLYRRVINRNNRLKHLILLGAPEIILRNEKRMLQESVDALIDVTQRPGQTLSSPLRSLSDMLRGKQGRFRQNLLGKRVDYSGRSVIVVGPDLKLNECGLPKEMALEMFKPFVLREVMVRDFAPNIKSAKRFIEKRSPEVFDILDEITKNHPVLLNRAPTLHKLSIQAFYPKLIEGSAISLHPCVCSGFNADFDGDQMAVHVPLSKNAQEESINLMMPSANLLKPADGSPITLPNKEMALGIYFLTTVNEEIIKEKLSIFSNPNEAFLANDLKKINIRELIEVRIDKKIVKTTVGRLMFNEALIKGMDFINSPIKASDIKKIVTLALRLYPSNDVANLIDNIKTLGFHSATISGISVSVFDNEMIENRPEMIKEAEKKVMKIEDDYQKGLITLDEKKRLSNDVWLETTDAMADKTWNNLKQTNVTRFIINSEGARAGKEQLKQLSAMRGLILDPLGKIVELPIKSNFREGLSIFEYVASARGSRKGLTDSALKTANAGYLTRRLVDVSHDVLVRSEDCGTDKFVVLRDDSQRTASFADRILGRTSSQKIVSKQNKKTVTIVEVNEEITAEIAKEIAEQEIKEIKVRSVFTCGLSEGICAKCYGWDFSTRKIVDLGTPVGVIAAQSIGEPGTQLTMRVKHFGGVVMSDVTQGLPRVEELFEMRTPKNLSPISQLTGKVKVEQVDDGYKIIVKNTKVEPMEVEEYFVPLSLEIDVKDGDNIIIGTPFARGYLDPKDILKIKGIEDTQKYILSEVQKVYESQGINISDKHFEVILRKMSDKIIIETVGDTPFVPGDLITKIKFEDMNAQIIAQGGEPAVGRQVMLGITKGALFSDSWLSAASFQETTRVITEAALEGKIDNLLGLKENVIIGRLIPV